MYAWGLGIMTNNQDKEMDMWQGLKQVKGMEIHRLNMIGDSMVLIRHLALHTNKK